MALRWKGRCSEMLRRILKLVELWWLRGAGIVPQRQCQRSEPEDRMPLEDGSGSFPSLYNVLDTTWHDIRGLGYARCVYAPGDS